MRSSLEDVVLTGPPLHSGLNAPPTASQALGFLLNEGRASLRENLDEGPGAVPEKSFRAQRLYDVDAGGACGWEHRSDYRRA